MAIWSAVTHAAIGQALFRLMKAGTIVRVARGPRAATGQQVEAQRMAGALAHMTGAVDAGHEKPHDAGDTARQISPFRIRVGILSREAGGI